jgi:hypothetical protein
MGGEPRKPGTGTPETEIGRTLLDYMDGSAAERYL